MAYTGGTVRLPIGAKGFSGSRNPSQMDAGFLSYVEGLAIDAGLFQKEGGAAKLNAAALDAGTDIRAGTSWSPSPGTNYTVVFTGGGKLLRDSGAGTFPTTYEAGLTDIQSPPPVFVPGGGESAGATRKLFMFSGSNQVRVASGTGAATAAIAAPAADWAASFPTFGVLHAFRMWGGGNASDPHRIYYSTAGAHGDYTAAGSGSLSIYPGEGDGLVGGISYKGLLILFKYPRGIYVVNTADPTPANWSVYPLSRINGAVNQHCIVPVEDDVLYLNAGAHISRLTATQVLGSVLGSDEGRMAHISPFLRSDINLAQIKRAVACWFDSKLQAWFCMPGTGGSENNLRLIADYNEGPQNVRFLTSRRDTIISLWTMLQSDGINVPMSGDSDGFVWTMDRPDRNKGGAAYELRFETPNMDLGFADPSIATKYKNGEFLELVSEPRGSWDLTVEVYWDDVLSDIVQFSMGSAGAGLGTFTLGVDALSSDVVRSDRRRIAGSGRRLRLIGYNEGLNQDVAVAEFWLSFKVADERIRFDT